MPPHRLAALALGLAFLLGGVTLVPAARGTDVLGPITVPTRWTRDGSPYTIQGNVVAQALLEIGPGVEVVFAGNYSLQEAGGPGAIYVNGSRYDPVVFRSAAGPAVAAWGFLDISGGHDCRISGPYSLTFQLLQPFERCVIESTYRGLIAYGGLGERITNLTIRHSTVAGLELAGASSYTISDILIDDVGTGIVFSHVGQPETGADPTRNDLHHITVTGFAIGFAQYPGLYAPLDGNRLTSSVFENGSTAFLTPFPGQAYGNNVRDTVEDFGFGGGGVGNFDDGSRGNFWSAYSGPDADGDGIGDVPYGPDRYPLIEPAPGAGARLPVGPPVSSSLGLVMIAVFIAVVAIGAIAWFALSLRKPRQRDPPS